MAKKIKVAVLDMYLGVANEGMRSLQNILTNFSKQYSVDFTTQIFDVRGKSNVPSLDYDIYISSGGPGSPLAENASWEKAYYNLIDSIFEHNKNAVQKKYVLLICHSFQVVMDYLKLAEVNLRHSPTFGIFPVHKIEEGKKSALLSGLGDPFYAVDSREWQVVQPDDVAIKNFGAEVLCIEKERPHVPYERAVMGMKLSNEVWGFQFHPEGDAEGMYRYFERPDKKESIIKNHGKEKYDEMIEFLSDPDKIERTQLCIIPSFLADAIKHIAAENEKV